MSSSPPNADDRPSCKACGRKAQSYTVTSPSGVKILVLWCVMCDSTEYR